MYLISSKRKTLTVLLVFFILVATMAAVIGQDIRYPTFEYYGQILSADEYLELVEQEVIAACVQIPSLEAHLSDKADIDFICFNTAEEADTYSNEVVPREWERFEREYPTPQTSQLNIVTMSSNHWALYAHTGYGGWIGNVYNSTSCTATSGVWSLWKAGSPNSISLYGDSSCTRQPHLTFSSSQFSCIWPWPLGCGGTTGARVP